MMVGVGILADFEAAMAGLDDSVACAGSVSTAERLLRTSTEVERQIQADRTRLISILDRAGGGASAEEALTEAGMSGAKARNEAQRARAHQGVSDALNDSDGERSSGEDESADAGGPEEGSGGGVGGGSLPPLIDLENLEAIARAQRSLGLAAEQDLFEEHRSEIAEMARTLEPAVFKIRLRGLVDRIRAAVAASTEERHRNASEAKSWVDADGMRHIHAKFDRERGDAVWNAIERETRSLAAAADSSDGEPLRLGPNLAAEAMYQLALRSHDPQASTARPLVGVFVDADTLEHGRHDSTVLERMGEPGSTISDEALRRYLCDCDLQALTTADGLPLAVGRKYRTATPAQRLALRGIYDTCAFPGCDVIFDWCHVHHLDWWEHGGRTDLDNLAPLCSRHHHLAHEGGWQMKLMPDRELRTWRPDGTKHAAATPCGPVTRWRAGQKVGGGFDDEPPDQAAHHREPGDN